MTELLDIPERPRLRPVEAFPARVEGEVVICLRDPSNVSPAVIGFSAEVLSILRSLDGTRTILEIQAAETRRLGRIVRRAEIEDIVRQLDEQLFLFSPRFEAARAAQVNDFRMGASRPAYHAGNAYPAEPDVLREWLDGFLQQADGPHPLAASYPNGNGSPAPAESGSSSDLSAILAPHIDFRRGGPVYAWAYRALAQAEPADVYIILGVPHQGLQAVAAGTLKAFDTPLGSLEVERDFVESLQRRSGFDLLQEELGHRTEHSIEFATVFLRHMLPDREFRIVPLLTSFIHELIAVGGNPADHQESQRFVEALGETISAYPGRVCIVGSVDLSHIGPQFGDPSPVTSETLDWLGGEDQSMLAVIEQGDAAAFYETMARDGDRRRVCGLSPIYTILKLLGQPGRLLKYGQAPDPNGTVSFASVVF